MGGAGIDSFWNHTFTATPTGTVPPTCSAPCSRVRTGTGHVPTVGLRPRTATSNEVRASTIRSTDGVPSRQVDFARNHRRSRGHQGFSAFYSTQGGTDLRTWTNPPSVPEPGTVETKDSRYYVAYSFDQYLYQEPAQSRRRVRALRAGRGLRRQSELAALVDVPRRPGRHGPVSGPGRATPGASGTTTTASAVTSRTRSRRPSISGRTGDRGLLRLAAHAVVRRGRRPAGDPARAGERHRGLAGPAGGDPVLTRLSVLT